MLRFSDIIAQGSPTSRRLVRFSTRPWRLVIFLSVVGPVVGISVVGYRQLERSLTGMALERRQSLAELSALALRTRLESLVHVGRSLAGRVQLRDRIAAGEWEEAILLLDEIPGELPYIERIFLADPAGILRADWPALPGVRGEDFSHRDWFSGVTGTSAPYVSETYLRSAPPQHRVVAAALPVFANGTAGTAGGAPLIGVLVLQVRVETLVDWSAGVSHGPASLVYFVDKKGRVAAHPVSRGANGLDLAGDATVRRLLRGEGGVAEIPGPLDGEPSLVAFEPITGFGWGVISQQPLREAFRGRTEALRAFRIRNGLFLLLGSALGVFIVAVVGTLRRYALEVSDLYHHAPCGYHSLDPGGVILRINQTELDWLGYETAEIVGKKKFTDLLTEEGTKLFERSFPRLKTEGAVKGLEFDLVRKDGTTLPVLVNAGAVFDAAGAFVKSRSTLFDMSEMRRARTALEAANAELEAFSYSVSHDLRAPLRAIDGFSLALIEDCGPKLAREDLDHLARIRTATQRMGALIDDLLNLSRVTRASMSLQTVDLTAIAKEILADLREQDPGRRVEIVVGQGPPVSGDASLLQLALRNLLENAWKFTSRRDDARIEFGSEGRDPRNGETVFHVRDNGAGFDMRYAPKLFGAFQRLHGHAEFPGTGVGLATVKRILVRHGGWITAEGTPGEGACFRFVVGTPSSRQTTAPP